MKWIFFLCLGAFGSIASAQGFALGELDTAWFENRNPSDLTLLEYLDDHLTEKDERQIVSFYDNPTTEPCAFEQYYTERVSYHYDGCGEEGGDNSSVVLPADTDLELLKKWIENYSRLADASMEYEAYWSEDTYAPHGAAGCYYSIVTDHPDAVVISIYCGC